MTRVALAQTDFFVPGNLRGPQQAHLLESLISHFQWTVLHTAGLRYLIQATVRSARDLPLHSTRHLLHDTTAIASLGLRYAHSIGLDAAAEAALSVFYQQVAQAMERTNDIFQRQSHVTTIPTGALVCLIPTWKLCCELAIRALPSVADVTRVRLAHAYSQNASVLTNFLQEGTRGETDRLGPSGDLELPALAQRRRHVRTSVEEVCTIRDDGRSLPAMVRNASRHGLGLSCLTPLPPQACVVVHLQDGRQLSAQVMHWTHGTCGLRLDHPLPVSDRLLAR